MYYIKPHCYLIAQVDTNLMQQKQTMMDDCKQNYMHSFSPWNQFSKHRKINDLISILHLRGKKEGIKIKTKIMLVRTYMYYVKPHCYLIAQVDTNLMQQNQTDDCKQNYMHLFSEHRKINDVTSILHLRGEKRRDQDQE